MTVAAPHSSKRQSWAHAQACARLGQWLVAALLVLCPVAAPVAAWAQTPAPAVPVPPAAPSPPAAPASATPPPSAATPSVVPCTGANNLLLLATHTATGITGLHARVHDGQLAQEGTFWSAPEAAILSDVHSSLIFDLGAPRELRALLLQGDNNDEYVLEGSTDGNAYLPVWVAPWTNIGQGLRTRTVVLPKPVIARYLRVQGRGGDNYYSVSEVQAFCKLPAVFPPKLIYPPKKLGWDAIDNDVMVNVKGVLGVFAGLLLLASQALKRIPSLRRRVGAATAVFVASLAGCGLGFLWNRLFDSRVTAGLGSLMARFGLRPIAAEPALVALGLALLGCVLVLGCFGESAIRKLGWRVVLVGSFFAATLFCAATGYVIMKGAPLPT
ncbi:MAG TPA: discoidin domain-containing protein, partial [Polyangiales bacterium]